MPRTTGQNTAGRDPEYAYARATSQSNGVQHNAFRRPTLQSAHAEINRVFMASEAWQLGPSLDGLDDLLYGGYGALAGHETATLVWRDIDRSREALGLEATRAWLEDKLRQPSTFNAETIGRQLDALQRGEGQTYFDIVMEIFASHPDITLVQA